MSKRRLFTAVMAAAILAAFSSLDADAAQAKTDRSLTHSKAAAAKERTPAGDDWRAVTKERTPVKDDSPSVTKERATVRDEGPAVTNVSNTQVQVPEPATMLLLGSAIGGLYFARRRMNKE